MAEAEQAYGLRFDTLLIDCEGCVNSFLKENHDALTNIRLILLEADQPKTIDYRKVIANLAKHGFEVVDKFQELDRPKQAVALCVQTQPVKNSSSLGSSPKP